MIPTPSSSASRNIPLRNVSTKKSTPGPPSQSTRANPHIWRDHGLQYSVESLLNFTLKGSHESQSHYHSPSHPIWRWSRGALKAGPLSPKNAQCRHRFKVNASFVLFEANRMSPTAASKVWERLRRTNGTVLIFDNRHLDENMHD